MSTKKKALQAAAGNAGDPIYVDDLFATNVWFGDASTAPIVNDVDFANEGGMLWIKKRASHASQNHAIFDTNRPNNKYLITNQNTGEVTSGDGGILSFNSGGFTPSTDSTINRYGDMVAWSFRKAPKFFDAVTYTGTGTTATNVPHNLGSRPGLIIMKRTDTSSEWCVVARQQNGQYTWGTNTGTATFSLNNTAVPNAGGALTSEITDTYFTPRLLCNFNEGNASGGSYVAYLFANNNNDGEFGEFGDQDIIKCGSYTGNGDVNGPFVDLGFEPQWLLIRCIATGSSWTIFDVGRGITSSQNLTIYANQPDPESAQTKIRLEATGFTLITSDIGFNASGQEHIYIAIRRPHRPAENGTDVLQINTYTGNATEGRHVPSSINTDLALIKCTSNGGTPFVFGTRLAGRPTLTSNIGNSENTSHRLLWSDTSDDPFAVQTGVKLGNGPAGGGQDYTNQSAYNYIMYNFRRSPGVFDIVSYKGSGSTTTLNYKNHNLGVVPELILVKCRSSSPTDWVVWHSIYNGNQQSIDLNNTSATYPTNYFYYNGAAVMSDTQFGVGSTYDETNNTNFLYLAYLFASKPGVSKVGSYVGNGTTQNIDCGFSSGARFVMVKATSTTGNWNVFDSTRGIVASNDARMGMNQTDADITSLDHIDPFSSGFTAVFSGLSDNNDINRSGVTYIYLAIA